MDKTLPHNTEFEQSIISSLLNNPETAMKIFDFISINDFYHTNHQSIFETAHSLFIKGTPVDLPSIGTAILHAGLIEKTGGSVYLTELMEKCPVPSSVEYYCGKLRELSQRRRLIIDCNAMMQDAGDLCKPLDAVHERLETVAMGADEARENRVPSRESLMISDDEWNDASLTPDCVVQDLIYSDVGTYAAPGGTGKTTQCLYEKVHVVLKRRLYGLDVRKPGWCLFITSEDSRERLIARLREIVGAIGLNDQEKAAIRRGILFWDVSGNDVRLIALEDGNIVLTSITDQIVRTYKDDPPVMVTIDPIISFGVGESRVNDNEQGLIMAARRIRNGLGCAVRLIHHTGKANARDKTIDQYTARGGSALPDGSRMVTILQAWDPKDNTRRPPQGCNPSPDSSITILARPKLSYAKPNLPLIWIKRTGWQFEYFTETFIPDEERDRAIQNQVECFIHSSETRGVFHNKTSLKAAYRDMGLKRDDVVDAVERLMAECRVVEKELPKNKQSTRRKTYLSVSPDSAGFKNSPRIGKTMVYQNDPEINPAAYRENPRRIYSAGDLPISLDPAAEPSPDSARFAGLPNKDEDSDRWETEI